MDNSQTMSAEGGSMSSMDPRIHPSGTHDNMMDMSNSMMQPTSGMPPMSMSMSVDPEDSSSQSHINPSSAITSISKYS